MTYEKLKKKKSKKKKVKPWDKGFNYNQLKRPLSWKVASSLYSRQLLLSALLIVYGVFKWKLFVKVNILQVLDVF